MTARGPQETADRAAARPVWTALGALVARTYGLQVVTLPALKAAARDAGFGGGRRPGGRELLELLVAQAGVVDVVAGLLIGGALLALVVLELRGRRVSAALTAALTEPGRAAPLLLLAGAWAVRAYAEPGLPHGFDAKQHMAKTFAVTDVLAHGAWPSWSWRWYGGFPLLRFYGPLSYVLAGSLGVVVGAVAGVKLVLVAAHLGGAWAFHRVARAWSGSDPAAVLATLVFLLGYQRVHTVLALGRLPEAVVLGLFPVLLLGVETFVARRTARTGFWTGATLGALLLTHPVMGALGGLFAGLYAALRLALSGAPFRRPGATLTFALLTGGLGVALAAFWLVPTFDERPLSQLDTLYGAGTPGLLPTRFAPRDLANLLRWGAPDRAASAVAYVGYSVLAFSTVALLRATRERWLPALVPAVLTLVTLAYAGGGYFLARGGAYCAPFLALLAGSAVRDGSGRKRLVLVAACLVVLDLAPLNVQSRFRPDLEGVRSDLAAVQRELGAARVVVAARRGSTIAVGQWAGWDGSGLNTLGGPFREGAGALYPWCMTVLGVLERDLADGGPLEGDTVAALRLLGVGAVVVEDGTRLVRPDVAPGTGYRIEGEPPVLRLDGPAPLLAAPGAFPVKRHDPAVAAAPPPLTDLPSDTDHPAAAAALADVLRAFGDPAAADWPTRIPLPPDGRPAPAPDAEDVDLEVRTTHVSDGELELEYALGAPRAVLLPFASYPGVRFELDGAPLATQPSVFGPPVARLPAGIHRIVIAGPDGPRDGSGRWISLAALVVLVLAGLGTLWTRSATSGQQGPATP